DLSPRTRPISTYQPSVFVSYGRIVESVFMRMRSDPAVASRKADATFFARYCSHDRWILAILVLVMPAPSGQRPNGLRLSCGRRARRRNRGGRNPAPATTQPLRF